MAKKEVIIGEFGLDDSKKDNPHAQNDNEVIVNLKLIHGYEAEASWRYYTRTGAMPQASKEKDKCVSNPDYVPCPAPMKIDKSGGWTNANCKRCNMEIPRDLKGRAARDWAIIHHEMEHADDWIERNSTVDNDQRNGHLEPPRRTTVGFPKWGTNEDDKRMIEMTESEKRIEQQRKKMRTSMASKANMAKYNAEKKQEKEQAKGEKIIVGESE